WAATATAACCNWPSWSEFTPTPAAPEASRPSVRGVGGRGAGTLSAMSSPKTVASELVYCSAVIRRRYRDEAEPSGSPVEEQPPSASTMETTAAEHQPAEPGRRCGPRPVPVVA